MQVRVRCLALVLVVSLGLAAACGQGNAPVAGTRLERETQAFLDTLARMELSARPETITALGLPRDALPGNHLATLGDRSQAGFERLRLRRIEVLGLMQSMPLVPESSPLYRHQEAVLRTYTAAVRVSGFGYGRVGLGDARPYVLDHRSGAWRDLPDLMVAHQPVERLADGDAFVSRAAAIAEAIEEERLRLVADADAGVLPPDFILDKLLVAVSAELDTQPGAHRLVAALDGLMAGMQGGLAADRARLRNNLVTVLRRRVMPAYGRLAATLGQLKSRAGSEPGVWSLPQGDAYYDALIAMHVREGVSAEALHRQGLEEVAALTEQLQQAFEALEAADPPRQLTDTAASASVPAPTSPVAASEEMSGREAQSVGEKLAELAAREDQRFEARADGDAALIAALETHIGRAERGLASWIARQPERPLAVQTAAAPDGWPGQARYTPPAPDGSRPATLTVDTTDLSAWPRFSLAALAMHEGIPGHHTEAAFAMEVARLPRIRQLMWHTGYGEGWATYAETLALEAGLYADDPLAEIGLLQSQLLRAARLVVDTGMHRLRWSREEAINYLVDTTGMPRAVAEAEVDRYTVWPGQAAAYTVGAREIAAMRERAETVLGGRFDLAAFHHTILAGGPRPLEQVEAELERWYEAQMR